MLVMSAMKQVMQHSSRNSPQGLSVRTDLLALMRQVVKGVQMYSETHRQVMERSLAVGDSLRGYSRLYCRISAIEDEYSGPENTLVDFLTDAMHLLGQGEVLQAITNAERHYYAELDLIVEEQG